MFKNQLENAKEIATLGEQLAKLASYLPKPYKAIGRECFELTLKRLMEDDNIPLEIKAFITCDVAGYVKHIKNKYSIMEISEKYLTQRKPDNQNNIDEDWFDLFLEECKTISNEQIQQIWGKVLAEECQNPNRIRKSFLPMLKTLDKKTAQDFQKINNMIFTLTTDNPQIPPRELVCIYLPSNNSLNESVSAALNFNLTSIEISDLVQNGLIDNTYSKEHIIKFPKPVKYCYINYFDTRIKIEIKNNCFKYGQVLLTYNGFTLSKFIEKQKNNNYIPLLLDYYKKQGANPEII